MTATRIQDSTQGELYPDEKIDAEVTINPDGTQVYTMRYPRREWGKWRLWRHYHKSKSVLEYRRNGNYCPAWEVYPILLSDLDSVAKRRAWCQLVAIRKYDEKNFRKAVEELVADGIIKEGV